MVAYETRNVVCGLGLFIRNEASGDVRWHDSKFGRG